MSNDVFHFLLNIIERKFFTHPTYLFLLLKPPFQLFPSPLENFIVLQEKKKMYTLIFYSKNNRKHFAIGVKYMKDGKNRLSFINPFGTDCLNFF